MVEVGKKAPSFSLMSDASEKVNLSNLKYLIIQYSSNDFGENKAFAENGNFLPIMSEKEYASIKKSLNAKHTYFFGRHSYHMLRELFKKVRKKMECVLSLVEN